MTIGDKIPSGMVRSICRLTFQSSRRRRAWARGLAPRRHGKQSSVSINKTANVICSL